MHRLIIAHFIFAMGFLIFVITPPSPIYAILPSIMCWGAFFYIAIFTFPKGYSFCFKFLWGFLYLFSFSMLYPFAFRIALKSYNTREQVKRNAHFLVILASAIPMMIFVLMDIYASLQH